MLDLLSTVLECEQPVVVCKLMQELAALNSFSTPDGCIAQSLVSMNRVKLEGRSNILVQLARVLGTMRPDGVDSLMPIGRMSVGLIEYTATFFLHTRRYMSMYVYIY